jgi:diadenosine tetraphosphate (Ap4A) HIT family hydrolase
MNPTIDKFGYPETLVHELDHWVVLLRPAQVTLGSLVLAAKSDVTSYGDLPREAFAEQGDAVHAIERCLKEFTKFERINYLMLMMVDPNVHFHVIPRYADTRTWNGVNFPDAGWPGPPRLDAATGLQPDQLRALTTEVAGLFR